MKQIAALALLVVAFLATAHGAYGQAWGLKANIPFAFTVGDTWMPAGEYHITSPNSMSIQLTKSGGSAVTSIVTQKSHNESTGGNQLVFVKYGDRYFLAHVLCPTNTSLNVDVPRGKSARRALEASHQTETMVIAAR